MVKIHNRAPDLVAGDPLRESIRRTGEAAADLPRTSGELGSVDVPEPHYGGADRERVAVDHVCAPASVSGSAADGDDEQGEGE